MEKSTSTRLANEILSGYKNIIDELYPSVETFLETTRKYTTALHDNVDAGKKYLSSLEIFTKNPIPLDNNEKLLQNAHSNQQKIHRQQQNFVRSLYVEIIDELDRWLADYLLEVNLSRENFVNGWLTLNRSESETEWPDCESIDAQLVRLRAKHNSIAAVRTFLHQQTQQMRTHKQKISDVIAQTQAAILKNLHNLYAFGAQTLDDKSDISSNVADLFSNTQTPGLSQLLEMSKTLTKESNISATQIKEQSETYTSFQERLNRLRADVEKHGTITEEEQETQMAEEYDEESCCSCCSCCRDQESEEDIPQEEIVTQDQDKPTYLDDYRLIINKRLLTTERKSLVAKVIEALVQDDMRDDLCSSSSDVIHKSRDITGPPTPPQRLKRSGKPPATESGNNKNFDYIWECNEELSKRINEILIEKQKEITPSKYILNNVNINNEKSQKYPPKLPANNILTKLKRFLNSINEASGKNGQNRTVFRTLSSDNKMSKNQPIPLRVAKSKSVQCSISRTPLHVNTSVGVQTSRVNTPLTSETEEDLTGVVEPLDPNSRSSATSFAESQLSSTGLKYLNKNSSISTALTAMSQKSSQPQRRFGFLASMTSLECRDKYAIPRIGWRPSSNTASSKTSFLSRDPECSLPEFANFKKQKRIEGPASFCMSFLWSPDPIKSAWESYSWCSENEKSRQ